MSAPVASHQRGPTTPKPSFRRIRENDGGLVHLDPPINLDQVTLCGITDWIGTLGCEEVTAPVTCIPCRSIADYCQSHRRMPARRTSALSSKERPHG